MSDSRTYLLGLALALSACATTQHKDQTPVGSTHAPYSAKPEYLGTRALPDLDKLRAGGQQSAIHISGPAPAVEEDPNGDDSDQPDPAPAQTQAAPQPQAAPQQGGSFTVAPSNEAPLPNRLPEPEQPWQPVITAPNPPQDHP